MACAKRFSRPPRYDRFDTSPCAKAIVTQTILIVNHNFIIFFKILLDITFQVWYSIQARKNAGVAQLVEQLICNQQVGGSSPSTSSIFLNSEHGSVPEWPKGADCKSVGTAFGGSNPPAPTKVKLSEPCHQW